MTHAELPVNAPGAVRVARNALSSLLRGVVTAPLSLVTTALILSRLGADALGVWALLTVFTSPIVYFDFGLAWSLSRLTAVHRADPDKLRRLVSSCLVLYLAIDAALLAVFALVREPVVAALARRAALPADDLSLALALALATFMVLLAAIAFAAALNGLEEIPWTMTAAGANQVVLTLAVCVALAPGGRLATLFWCALAGACVQAVVQVHALTKVLGFFPIRSSAIRRDELAELVTSSLKLSTLIVFRVTFYCLDKWLLAAFSSARLVGYYELGSRLGVVFRGLLNTMCTPLLSSAAVASTSALKDAKLARLSFYSLRYLLALAVPTTVVVALIAPQILEVWVGRADPEAVSALRWLVPSCLVNALTWGILFLLIGIDRVGVALVAGFVALVANLAIDLITLSTGASFDVFLAGSLAAGLLPLLGLVAYQVRSGMLSGRALMVSLARFMLASALGGAALYAIGTLMGVIVFAAVNLGVLALVGEIDAQDRFFLSSFGGLKNG